jgi:signal peptidase II
MKERIKHLILVIILVVIDQVTKYLVRTSMDKPIIIIPNVLSLENIRNTGAAWGILKDSGYFLRIFTLILLFIIIYLYFKIPAGKRFRIIKILTLFMMAGAIGNLIDRFFLGYVVDFIYFEIIDFPLFNFADSCLTVSCIILFLLALFYYKDDDFAFLEKIFHWKKRDNSPKTDNEVEISVDSKEKMDLTESEKESKE